MKNLFVAIFIILITTMILLFARPVLATQVTLTDPDEEITSDGVKICIYSNKQNTKEFYIGKSSKCPYTKTFEVSSDE